MTVAASDVLIKFTYKGDANLDGQVNGDDYFELDSVQIMGWLKGDFDYDGDVDSDDYFAIDSNLGGQGPQL